MADEEPTPSQKRKASNNKKGLNNHIKGLEFELRFRDFMRTRLGLTRVSHRQQVQGKDLVRPMECDLLAWRTSRRWLFAASCGLTLSFVCAIMALISRVVSEDTNARALASLLDDTFDGISPHLAGWGFTIVVVVTQMLVLLALSRRHIRIWVECRDTRLRVNRNYVFAVDGRRSQARWFGRHATDEVWIVSASGFDPDALLAARERKIICIQFYDGTATIMNGLSSRIPGFRQSAAAEPLALEKTSVALWAGVLLIPVLAAASIAVPRSEPWWCVCYQHFSPNGPAPMTACRRFSTECEALRNAVHKGAITGAVPDSVLTACIAVDGAHPGDGLGERSAWKDSMKEGAYISHSGCLLH